MGQNNTTAATEVWDKCLHIIKDNITQQSYKNLFERIVAVSLHGSTLTIQVPTHFTYEYIEEHYIDLLGSVLRKELGNDAKLDYTVIVGDTSTPPLPSNPQPKSTNRTTLVPNSNKIFNPFVVPGLSKTIDPQLNPNYIFDNYIEGECNQIARSIALSVTKNPGQTAFNPLFVHSGSGLGKTHLIQAIGNEVCKSNNDKTVLYISAHKFQQQFAVATLKNNTPDFLSFYQMIDVLIIDDIQDLSGKQSTQDAFFHILDYLHRTKKQIILSSDKAPVDLIGIEQRLLSRFKWGTSVYLQQPDFKTRLAIVKYKAYQNGLDISDEILSYIAENVCSNIRELEGTLNSVLAQSTYSKNEINMSMVKDIIHRLIKETPKLSITINSINQIVANYFNISIEKLLDNTRKREIVQARQIAMYFHKNYTNTSLTTIGTEMGGKNHATVLHACKTVENLMETDKQYKNIVENIRKKVEV